jgi:hypothetical protein
MRSLKLKTVCLPGHRDDLHAATKHMQDAVQAVFDVGGYPRVSYVNYSNITWVGFSTHVSRSQFLDDDWYSLPCNGERHSGVYEEHLKDIGDVPDLQDCLGAAQSKWWVGYEHEQQRVADHQAELLGHIWQNRRHPGQETCSDDPGKGVICPRFRASSFIFIPLVRPCAYV